MYEETEESGEAKLTLDEIFNQINVADLLSKEEIREIGLTCVANFEMDRRSRWEWEARMEKANKIALQVIEEKSFPWPKASNVKFPLLTIAALQYHSRAYPALLNTPYIVRCGIVGEDQDDQKSQAARRVEDHMNWQLTEEDENWEADHDKALLVQCIMGCVFKKSYFDSSKKCNVSETVLPQDFVVSYYTKSLTDCPRATHIQIWFYNDLVEKQRRGEILETDLTTPSTMPTPFGQMQDLKDKVQGLQQVSDDPDQPFYILEQMCFLDLDDDGYKEPYICWIRYDTSELLRILPCFLPSGVERNAHDQIVKITPEQFYTKIPFIPSPDGGFYDLGFGHLLGPLNESIDTAINQLFDAGTMHNAGGGFLGRGARIRGGSVSIRPNEWIRVDSTGDDLRKSIVELPLREPSAVLFNLLSLLIDYGQRVAGANDAIQGMNPGQNTPAETSRNMVEQGMKIFSGIYKRTYRALKDELRKLYRLNMLHLEQSQEFSSPHSGLPMKVLDKDYKLPSSAIRPAADPNYISESEKKSQALGLMEAARGSPGYDMHEVNMFYLRALRIPNPEKYHPDPKGPNAIPSAPDVKIQIEQMRQQQAQLEFQAEMQMKAAELMDSMRLNAAKIKDLESHTVLQLAQVDDEDQKQAIVTMQTTLSAAKMKQEGDSAALDMLHKMMKLRADTMLGHAQLDLAKSKLNQGAK